VPATPVAAPNTLPASLEGFRPTGIGQNAHGGQIFSRAGKDGAAEFTNQATAQAQPRGLAAAGQNIGQQQQPAFKSLSDFGGARQQASAPLSLASVFGPSGQSDESAPSLASLGSLENIGNGLGVASFGTPGDAKAAIDTYERANQIRRDGANQDRLDLALARQGNANQMTVVRDSSRGPSLNDLIARRQEGQGDAQRQSRLEDVGLAQGIINTTQTQRAQQAASNRASRLEDLQIAATAPGATADDLRNYQMAVDPAGYLKAQQSGGLTQLKLQGQQLDNQIKQQTLSGAETKAQQALDDRQLKSESAAATFDQALASVDSLLGTQPDPNNPDGPNTDEDPGLRESLGLIDGILPTLPGGKAADFEARLDTLKAQTFLPQVQALKGAGALSDAEGKKLSDSIGALSTKMSEQAFRESLRGVKATLAAARERAAPSSAQQPAAPAVGQAQDGYVFLGGDPANQASWRAQ
jgi:hypothetical protein